MKIEESSQRPSTSIKAIPFGGVFSYNGDYYMSIEYIESRHLGVSIYYNAVRLSDGCHVLMQPSDEIQYFPDAKLVV